MRAKKEKVDFLFTFSYYFKVYLSKVMEVEEVKVMLKGPLLPSITENKVNVKIITKLEFSQMQKSSLFLSWTESMSY